MLILSFLQARLMKAGEEKEEEEEDLCVRRYGGRMRSVRDDPTPSFRRTRIGRPTLVATQWPAEGAGDVGWANPILPCRKKRAYVSTLDFGSPLACYPHICAASLFFPFSIHRACLASCVLRHTFLLPYRICHCMHVRYQGTSPSSSSSSSSAEGFFLHPFLPSPSACVARMGDGGKKGCFR